MSNRIKITLALALLACVLLGVGALVWPRISVAWDMRACAENGDEGTEVDCIFQVIESEYDRAGITAAMRVFSVAYENFHSFASTGCHKYAHRMGDIAYYRDYLNLSSIEEMDFPQEVTACGYGFFHGFMEHLVQDNPTPEFVRDTCNYLTDRLGGTMGSVRIICFHGSGHGFMLATAEHMTKREWGNVRSFTKEPSRQCGALPGASEREISECRQGVFTVLVEWMAEKQFGFSYDTVHPFRVCASLPSGDAYACRYEMSQKLDLFSNLDPVRMRELLRDTPKDFAPIGFGVGISGIIQQTIADDGYEPVLQSCAPLDDQFFRICAISLMHGLFEHGLPQEEYVRAMPVCAEPLVRERGIEAVCYEAFTRRLERFYTPQRRQEICRALPDPYAESCLLTYT